MYVLSVCAVQSQSLSTWNSAENVQPSCAFFGERGHRQVCNVTGLCFLVGGGLSQLGERTVGHLTSVFLRPNKLKELSGLWGKC